MCARFHSNAVRTEYVLIGGIAALGIFSLSAGFVSSKIVLLTLRALDGVASAMTIRSAMSLIFHIFPEQTEQSRALGVFEGSWAIGNGQCL